MLSQWTMALISTVLIVFPMMSGEDNANWILNKPISEAIQVGFAVLVLVASQVIGALNFTLRAELFHKCGIELDQLCYRILNLEENHKYYDLYKKYISILEKYENHKTIDYVKSKTSMRSIYYKEDSLETQTAKNTYFIKDVLKFFFLNFIEFFPYLAIPSLLCIIVYFSILI